MLCKVQASPKNSNGGGDWPDKVTLPVLEACYGIGSVRSASGARLKKMKLVQVSLHQTLNL
jgi:hypothetical protein